MELRTERNPVLPPGFPMVILVNEFTASSSEIVTGALQFHERALIVGTKTFGKGSVQTIIPLKHPESTALRLTTALHYTPAHVTIDRQGIIPDVEVPFSRREQQMLRRQMSASYEDDPEMVNQQNHGSVTGNEPTDWEPRTDEENDALREAVQLIRENYGEVTFENAPEETIEDKQLKRAAEILREDTVWENLLLKYHRDVAETQLAADAEEAEEGEGEGVVVVE